MKVFTDDSNVKEWEDLTPDEIHHIEFKGKRYDEVRHGEWVFKFYCGNMSGYDYGMNCSVCGKPMYRQFAEKMPPYCPNCGARMVNEDE